MYKKALISVSDKTGLADFLTPLVPKGLKIVSTGGTGEFLKSKGFKVQDVKDLSSFPPVLGGRVKTLHPHIYIPLLAREWLDEDQKVLKQYKLTPFDLVIVNLYPFEKKALGLEDKELVEWIDIGGPSLLRAAAKNYFSITTLCDPGDFSQVQNGTNLKKRKQLAVKVFQRLSQYNLAIANSLNEGQILKPAPLNPNTPLSKIQKENSKEFVVKARFFKKLRYGENPHQEALWLKTGLKGGLDSAQILQGKALSYNNILDFVTAILTVREFEEPCAVAVKHNNPCGAALADSLPLAVKKALKADPLSVFGGLLAFNRPLDFSSARIMKDVFLEGLIAPDFSSQALNVLKGKKNLRILKWPEMLSHPLPSNSIHEIIGGFLIQTRDKAQKTFLKSWKIVGTPPPKSILSDLIFAWKLCAHLKSNAITIVKKGQSLGLGMGQVSRVSAVRLALNRASEFHPNEKKGLILASDAFFPFPDSIELAAQGGVSWIIQPGGSIKDEQIIQKALACGINMILTGQRHFKH